MKSPKKPSKEPPLPSQDEVRRANVLRAEMLSQFRVFGESLSSIREDVSGIKPRLDKLTEKVDVLESAVRTHTQEIRAHSLEIRSNTQEIRSHSQEIHSHSQEIRSLKDVVQENTAATHAIQTDLKGINQRLEVVEAKS